MNYLAGEPVRSERKAHMPPFNSPRDSAGSPAARRYRRERIAHWDRTAGRKDAPDRPAAFYHALLRRYYRFLVPEGLRVLELGCGNGDLLAALKPSLGVGVDFSAEMIRLASRKHPDLHFTLGDVHELFFQKPFDIIILSDLLNDLWDVQRVLENLRQFCHSGTRVVINFYNNLWRIPLAVVKQLGLGAEMLEQNWFSPHDVVNLLQLAGFETVKHQAHVLLPFDVPFAAGFANRYLVHLVPFRWFALTNIIVARPLPTSNRSEADRSPGVSVIVPARNEAGNIGRIIDGVPAMGSFTEIIFVEGLSTDQTYETIEEAISDLPCNRFKLLRQTGRGKGDAVRLGFEAASGDILMILDADLTVPPEDLPRFYRAITTGKGEFINGVRLVYPLENRSMRFLNILGNKFFSLAFSWLLGQPVKDTLCGTKVLRRCHYDLIVKNRQYFGDFDPFGDFDLLFGAAKLNLKIAEMPIRYRARDYGDTNISRWRHGWLLLKMVVFAARQIKFV